MKKSEMKKKVNDILQREYSSACRKHPEFADSLELAVCVIAEEFGELAKEILEKKYGWKSRAVIEASHVAVTAVRMMGMLIKEKNLETEI